MSKIKSVLKCDEKFKALFKESRCLLTISVGQEVHEGEKFSSTLDLVNKTFNSCVMLIDDSLQRHTMALGSKNKADYFYNFSIKEGDAWLERNEVYFGRFKILKEIVRWDTWLKHPDYSRYKDKIILLMQHDDFFKKSFESTIDLFLNRYLKRINRNSELNMKNLRMLCEDYLVEECAAFCLWPQLNCQFEVYPGKRNFAMNETHRKIVLSEHPQLLHAVSVKFINRKRLQPQNFSSLSKSKSIMEGLSMELL